MPDPLAVATGIGSMLGAASAAFIGYQQKHKKPNDTTDHSERLTALEKSVAEEKLRVTATAAKLESGIESLKKEMGFDRKLNNTRHTANTTNFEEIKDSQKEVQSDVKDILKILGSKADRADLRK